MTLNICSMSFKVKLELREISTYGHRLCIVRQNTTRIALIVIIITDVTVHQLLVNNERS